ncbi:MAG: hypothetical protein ACLUD0_05575 [Eubacterium ramulus]
MSQLIPSIMSHGFERSTAMTMMTVGAIVAIPLSYLFGVIDAKKGSRATVIIFFIWCAMELTLLILRASMGDLSGDCHGRGMIWRLRKLLWEP